MMSCTVAMDRAYTTTYRRVNTHLDDLFTHSSAMSFNDVIKDLVNRAIEKSGGDKTVTSISREIGMKQPTLLRIMNGESKNPRRENLAPIARYFKCDVDDFYSGKLPPDLGVAPLSQEAGQSPRSMSIDGRMDMLEEMLFAAARTLGIDVDVIVGGSMEDMRERVRSTLAGVFSDEQMPRSDRDERGIGQPTPSGDLPVLGPVNAWGGAERRHSAGRRRSN